MPEACHIMHEIMNMFVEMLTYSPSFYVRVQGSTTTGLHFSACGQERPVGAEDSDGGSSTVGAPSSGTWDFLEPLG